MKIINDYEIITKIYESANSLVYRAIRTQDERPIILKILKEDYPTAPELTRYKQEYEITRSLNLDGVVKVYDLQRYQNSLVMFLEDFGGESLKIWIAEHKLTLEEFLILAIEITENLGAIHAANIIHKDINPSNIVYNPETGKLKIIDFGIATVLPRENPTILNLDRLEGTLAYISPEQTGRMNRVIDYRTDFYSVGVTFYEMLVGRLPFETTDPMELVHCHIAKQPVPAYLVGEQGLRPEEEKGTINDIPKAVSDIVMKLMAKTAEDRYQSVWGLKADLEACLYQLQNNGQIVEFPIGQRDISSRFEISQKLYGREEEVAQLLATFEQVSQGSTEMILVAGYSGIGKSALVNEVHKPIARQGGHFISGKFEQFKQDIPYAALIQAFQELMRQLLTESEAQIHIWREKLLEAVSSNGQAIVDVIPEVELIIGKQTPVPQLGPTESQNRFNILFQNFISVFTTPEHPLVLFLDDLQWADAASLKLLELLMIDEERQYLLTFGAYRDNEVSPTHPLMQTVEKIQKLGTKIKTITLRALDEGNINQLIADTLHCPTEASLPLAELVLNKTEGNPFFLTQLLLTLYQKNLLLFNSNTGCWQWEIEQIQAAGITDNVVELTIAKIEQLDESTQNILKLAACIGNRFDLSVLSVVNAKSQSATARELWPALQQGLILPLSDRYKIPLLWNQEEMLIDEEEIFSIPYIFLHDRVQQAAYALIPEMRKKEVHLEVGQLLLKNTPQEQLEENIFDIVNQLNFGSELFSRQLERDNLAQLNLIAGNKAKNATAYEPALKYLEMGLELLSSDSWQYQYELTLELYLETVAVQYINTQFDRAEALASVVLEQAKELLDRVKVYELKIQSYIAKFQFHLAINVALETLKKLRVELPQKPSQYRIKEEHKSLKSLLKDKPIENLFELPDMIDPYKLAAIRILLAVTAPAIITNPTLYFLITLRAVNLCINYGNPPQAAGVYIFYGKLLCGIMKDIDSGYRFGQLSLRLLEKFNIKEFKSLVLHYSAGFIRPWKEPIHNSNILEVLQAALNVGLDTGDIEHTSYNASAYCLFSLFLGLPLEEIYQKYEKYINLTIKIKQSYTINYMKNCSKIAISLLNGYQNNYCLVVGDSPEEEEQILDRWTQERAEWLLFSAYLAKTISYYFFKHYDRAVSSGMKADKNAYSSAAYLITVQHNFYYSLALLGNCNPSEINTYKNALKQVSSNQKTMKMWASHCPENFQHKYDLVAAERARVLGRNGQAAELYDKAIQGAQKK